MDIGEMMRMMSGAGGAGVAGIGVGCVEGGRLHRRLPQQERDDGVSAGRRHGAPRLQGLPQARQNGRGTRDLHTIFTSGAAVDYLSTYRVLKLIV